MTVSFLHSVLTLAEEETYFPFPATDTYLFTFSRLVCGVSTDAAIGCRAFLKEEAMQ